MKPSIIGLTVMVACLLMQACYDPDEYVVPTDVGDRFQLQANRDSLAADGSSVAMLTAYVPQETTKEGRMVKFATTAGLFVTANASTETLEAAVNPDSLNGPKQRKERLATVMLRSGLQTGDVTLTASTSSLTRQKSIKFFRVGPERIGVTANSFFVQSNYGREVEVTASVSRNVGRPSTGTIVRFAAIDDRGTSIGRFRNVDSSSDELGRATATYGLLDSTYVGNVRIIAATTFRGSTFSDTVLVNVLRYQKP